MPNPRFDLTIHYMTDQDGWVTATIPAVPGTVSFGKDRRHARANVVDALREMLAVPFEGVQPGVEVERIGLSLQAASRNLGLDR